jgi:hypothetical protein
MPNSPLTLDDFGRGGGGGTIAEDSRIRACREASGVSAFCRQESRETPRVKAST